jgi:hypothetical protein
MPVQPPRQSAASSLSSTASAFCTFPVAASSIKWLPPSSEQQLHPARLSTTQTDSAVVMGVWVPPTRAMIAFVFEFPYIRMYNLGCHYAVAGDKPHMLQSITAARRLGKPTQQFMADTDFARYLKDEDFLKAVEEQR